LNVKVEILQQRITDRFLIIIADVSINGVVRRQTYSVDRNFSEQEITQFIINKIKQEGTYNETVRSFEVDI